MTYLVEDGLKFKFRKLYDMHLLVPKGVRFAQYTMIHA